MQLLDPSLRLPQSAQPMATSMPHVSGTHGHAAAHCTAPTESLPAASARPHSKIRLRTANTTRQRPNQAANHTRTTNRPLIPAGVWRPKQLMHEPHHLAHIQMPTAAFLLLTESHTPFAESTSKEVTARPHTASSSPRNRPCASDASAHPSSATSCPRSRSCAP
eukprot:14763244-Alexandrium_andersonii.AAC.1